MARSLKQWLARRESWFDWMTAWFGGSALTAFQLHNAPDAWTSLTLALLCAATGITAHRIKAARHRGA